MDEIGDQVFDEEVSMILSTIETHAIYQCKAKHPEWSCESQEAFQFRQDYLSAIMYKLNSNLWII